MQHQSLFNKSQWTQLVKRFSAVAVLGLTIATPAWAIDPTVKELRIGFQKSSINFAIAKQQKLFEQEFPNAKITWNEFPAGPQILEALAVGSLDVGVTGDTPRSTLKPLASLYITLLMKQPNHWPQQF